ncbi:hypothetical protein MASR2M8_02180 [Opitutaceae bacterium]
MSFASPVITHAAHAARDSVEGLYLEQATNRPWIYWLLLLGLGATLTALPLITIAVGVQAPGWVRSRTERMEIRSALSGRIDRVLVQENDRVVRGQALLQLRAEDIEERLRFNRLRQEESRATQNDLQQLLRHYTRAVAHPAGTDASLAFPADQETTALQLTLPRLIQDARNVRAHWNAQNLSVAQFAARLDRASVLAAKGWIPIHELETARHEWRQQQANAQLVLQNALARWEENERDEERLLSSLVSEERRLREEQALHTIRAPVAGTVVNFAGWGAEAYVMPGQILGQVSPDDSLIVESRVSPRDAALIRPGQQVRLRIDAYPSTRWGVLPARVVSISDDLTTSAIAEGEGFKVLVQPDQTTLTRPDGIEGQLRKGLTLTAHFVVDHRSLWQLLRDKAGPWLEPPR